MMSLIRRFPPLSFYPSKHPMPTLSPSTLVTDPVFTFLSMHHHRFCLRCNSVYPLILPLCTWRRIELDRSLFFKTVTPFSFCEDLTLFS